MLAGMASGNSVQSLTDDDLFHSRAMTMMESGSPDLQHPRDPAMKHLNSFESHIFLQIYKSIVFFLPLFRRPAWENMKDLH